MVTVTNMYKNKKLEDRKKEINSLFAELIQIKTANTSAKSNNA
jgi:hypothetical protein